MENLLLNDDRYTGFPKLINKLNLKIGVEVGTREGFYAKYLLLNSSLEKLYAVDNNPATGYMNAMKEEFGEKFIFLDAKSPNVANTFEDGFFDFIYIDAWHTYEACKADLNGWWSKLRKGGLFAGDDFLPARDHPESKFGVDEAVEEFCEKQNLTFFVTGCVDNTREGRYNYSEGMWNLLKNKLHESHKNFQIPQWWLIK